MFKNIIKKLKVEKETRGEFAVTTVMINTEYTTSAQSLTVLVKLLKRKRL